MKTNGLLSEIRSNWAIIVTIAGMLIAFTTLSGRVGAIEGDHDAIDERLSKIENLIERVIIIEERTTNNREDILEIKEDIKDVKRHFEIK